VSAGARNPTPAAGRPLPAAPQDAADLGDDLVQLLAVAKYALSLGDAERATVAVDTALGMARAAITALSDATLAARAETETVLSLTLRSRPAPTVDRPSTPAP
jgi:hypothetical protein